MKYIFLLLVTLLSACEQVQTRKEPGILPLSSIVPLIKEGMSGTEVEKALSGHKPALQFTRHNDSIWEIRERTSDPMTHSINANRLVIVLDKNGKVSQSLSSFCFLPDQQPILDGKPATSCYQKHLFPFDKQLTYNAIKRLLIISNYQVDHSDAASELISATGTHSVEGDDDKMMFIKLSMAFSNVEKNGTEVVMSASFSTSEKQSTWVQAGFGGVTLPVPLPFQKTEEWIDTGIVSPKFYLNFYDALTNLIASEYLPYRPMIASTPEIRAVNREVSQFKPKPVTPAFNNAFSTGSKMVSSNDFTEDHALFNLAGPIDSEISLKNKKPVKESEDNQVDQGKDDVFSQLQGIPIDSDKLKNTKTINE